MCTCVRVHVRVCWGDGTDMESLRAGRLEEARDYSKEAILLGLCNQRQMAGNPP